MDFLVDSRVASAIADEEGLNCHEMGSQSYLVEFKMLREEEKSEDLGSAQREIELREGEAQASDPISGSAVLLS